MKTKLSMPRTVQKRIMERAANGERALVVVIKNRKPSRIFGLDQYLKRKALPKEVKPWEKRKQQAAAPDPLGAVDLGAVGSMRREDIYE